jgi:predicted nucleotide-binding protein
MQTANIEKVLKIIDDQLEVIGRTTDQLDQEIPIWKDRTIRKLKDYILRDELNLFNKLSGGTWEQERYLLQNFLTELKNGIKSTSEFYMAPVTIHVSSVGLNVPTKVKPENSPKKEKSKKVFVVHGHDSLAKVEVARTLEKLGLEAIILHEQPNEGKTVIEKFERDALQVTAAIIIMSGDDIGYPKNKVDEQKPRARQNVVLELGYFSGMLGRANVCVLFKDDIEIPSDYLGVVYVPMDTEGGWKFKMAKELKQTGLSVDLNNLV